MSTTNTTTQIPIGYWDRNEVYDNTRGNTDLRPVVLHHNKLTRSDGSVEYRQGQTIVFCTTNGPLPCEGGRQSKDRAIVEVNLHLTPIPPSTVNFAHAQKLHYMPDANNTNAYANTYKSLLTKQLHELATTLLELKSYPKQKFVVSFDVLSQDGSLLSALSNAFIQTVFNSGVPANLTTYTVTCARVCYNEEIFYKLDPTLAQEADALGLLTISFKMPNYVHNVLDGSSIERTQALKLLEKQEFDEEHKNKKNKPQFESTIDEKPEIVQMYSEKAWKSTELFEAIEICTKKFQEEAIRLYQEQKQQHQQE